jgi:hypothetical protein
MGQEFKKVRQEIAEARDNDYNVIPSFFNRFAPWFPGIMRGNYTIISANSGVGKSIFMRKVYIYDPIEFIEKNPDQKIKYHAMIFLLEESKKSFILKGISKQLWERYNISVSTRDLLSYFNNKQKGVKSKITDEVLKAIDEIEPYFDKIEEYVELIDHIRNPTGIWMHIRKYASEHGKFYWVERDGDGIEVSRKLVPNIFKKDNDGNSVAWNHYEPDDPNAFVLIVIDHISLVSLESGMNQHATIGRLSSEYLIRARNHFGYSPVVVQQQASDKEKIEVNFKGDTNEEKLEPSLDGLANNKETQRDANVVYGIFGPSRYGIKEHNGYDITRLGNSYRYFKCLKDRDGEPNVGISLYFNGKIGNFEELPSINPLMDKAELNQLYKKYPEIRADS